MDDIIHTHMWMGRMVYWVCGGWRGWCTGCAVGGEDGVLGVRGWGGWCTGYAGGWGGWCTGCAVGGEDGVLGVRWVGRMVVVYLTYIPYHIVWVCRSTRLYCMYIQ